jgi:hypothetical protein
MLHRPLDNWVERSPTPFVAVSIYYRLSSLGFLAAPEAPDKGIHAGEGALLLCALRLFANSQVPYRSRASSECWSTRPKDGTPFRPATHSFLRWRSQQSHNYGSKCWSWERRIPHCRSVIQSKNLSSYLPPRVCLTAQNDNPNEQLFHRAILQSWYRAPLLNPVERKVGKDDLSGICRVTNSAVGCVELLDQPGWMFSLGLGRISYASVSPRGGSCEAYPSC